MSQSHSPLPEYEIALDTSDDDEDEGVGVRQGTSSTPEPDPQLRNTRAYLIGAVRNARLRARARNRPREVPPRPKQPTEFTFWYKTSLQALKFFSYISGFAAVLVGALVSKVCLLLMTSQLRPGPSNHVRYCLGRTDHVEVRIPELETILWSWVLAFCFMVPELLVFARSVRICIFKKVDWPTLSEFMVPFTFESLHVIGLALLIFVVLPSLDAIAGIMLFSSVCLLPAMANLGMRLLRLFQRIRARELEQTTMPLREQFSLGLNSTHLTLFDSLALTFLLLGWILWPILAAGSEDHQAWRWALPISVLLTSCRWWENYLVSFVNRRRKEREVETGAGTSSQATQSSNTFFDPFGWLAGIPFECESRYVSYLFISLWKCGLFIACMVAAHGIQGHGPISHIFSHFGDAFASHQLNITEIRPYVIDNSLPIGGVQGEEYRIAFTEPSTPLKVMAAQIVAGLATYLAAKFACKVGMQGVSFALPLSLVVPVGLPLLSGLCASRIENECFGSDTFPRYLFLTCPQGGSVLDQLFNRHGWVWVLWTLAQTWITRHIWFASLKKLEPGEHLFVAPFYDGLLVDQSLLLNRRREEGVPVRTRRRAKKKSRRARSGHAPERLNQNQERDTEASAASGQSQSQSLTTDVNNNIPRKGHVIPKVLACATLWHEEGPEMMEMIQSIIRLDRDQWERRYAREHYGSRDPDYYELETHFIFDDAFKIAKGTAGHAPRYVRNKYVKILLATMEKAVQAVHGSTKILLAPPTKIVTPYGGRLVWTLPGQTTLVCHLKNKAKIRHKKRWSQVMYMYYLLSFGIMEREDISRVQKAELRENTFILALDGDIAFLPSAVHRLLDLMKKDSKLGAACGRIHPVGAGSSLMVAYQKFEYAIGHWFQKATEHVIGCVLCSPGCFSLFRASALLADNVLKTYTTEPSEARHHIQYDQGEDRWLCTLLLKRGYRIEYSAASDSWTHCPESFKVFFNQRRRWAPSTMANVIDLLNNYERLVAKNKNISRPYIFYQLVLTVGSILGPGTIFLMLIGAFNVAFRISNSTALIWNAVPVLIFILVCYFCEQSTQILVAQILAAIYALVMVAVVVALLMQIQEDGPLAPSSLFFFGVAASFILAAALHPLEFGCLWYGLVYYITIPTMYMILFIYALMNLHDVSWGTRSSGVDEEEEEDDEEDEGAQGVVPPPSQATAQMQSQNLGFLARLFGTQFSPPDTLCSRMFVWCFGVQPGTLVSELTAEPGTATDVPPQAPETPIVTNVPADVDENKWLEDLALVDARLGSISTEETEFWVELIHDYLLPFELKYKPKKWNKMEKETKEALLELRNTVTFFFFMINAVFVLAIFLLQNNKETIHVDWPFGSQYNMTYVVGQTEILLHEESLSLEPIGIVFVFVFAIILGIQLIAMFFHRAGTFVQIMATVTLEFGSKFSGRKQTNSGVKKGTFGHGGDGTPEGGGMGLGGDSAADQVDIQDAEENARLDSDALEIVRKVTTLTAVEESESEWERETSPMSSSPATAGPSHRNLALRPRNGKRNNPGQSGTVTSEESVYYNLDHIATRNIRNALSATPNNTKRNACALLNDTMTKNKLQALERRNERVRQVENERARLEEERRTQHDREMLAIRGSTTFTMEVMENYGHKLY